MRITLRNGRLVDATPPGPPPGRRMSGHTDRSGTTIHGWGAALFGLPFAGIGSFVSIAAALGRMRPSGGTNAPPWVLVAMGLVFAVIGLLLVVHGVRGVARRREVAARRAGNPREPWTWDRDWDAFGVRDDSGRRIARAFGFAGFMVLFLVPFNWVSFLSGDGAGAFKTITGLFDAAAMGVLGWAIHLLARRRKYGVGVLRFRRFPFHPGDEVEMSLARVGPLASLPTLEATLRCVQERYEVTRRGGKRRSEVVSYEVWSETRGPEQGDGRRSTERDFTWRFTLPEAVPGTELSERPPRYWELEVKAEMPGVDYAAVFLVPVYEDPRGARRERLVS